MTAAARPVWRTAVRWPVTGGGLVLIAAASVVAARRMTVPPDSVTTGIAEPGALTDWGLPTSRALMVLASAAVAGLLLAATLFTPRAAAPAARPALDQAGRRLLRSAGQASVLWLATIVTNTAFVASDLFGVPVWRLPDVAAPVLFGAAQGRVALVAGAVAVLVAVTASAVRTAGATAGLLAATLVALAAPAFAGHSAGEGNHQVAVSSLVIHVVAGTVWAGALIGLLATGRARPESMARAARRCSAVAATCMIAVAGSGVLAGGARLGSLSALTSSAYGALLIAKACALLGLAAVAFRQRRRALPAVAAGRRAGLIRLAVLELVIFAATFGIAAGLSRTAAPSSGTGDDPAVALLGFPMPGPPTARSLVAGWLPEPLTLTAAAAAVVLYLGAVIRLRRRGDAWPASSTALWVGGWAVVVVATNSGLARYSPVLFSAHMIQHMTLTMVAPIMFVLAAPVTLALRGLRPAADRSWPGPREWVTAALHSRPARVLTHPAAVFAIYTVSLYGMYLTDVYELALRSHLGHLLMTAHFLLAGYLFFWVLVGTDPAPRPRPAFPLRLVILLMFMAMHAIFGLVMMQTQVVIAGDWYAELARPWGGGALADQKTGGGIAWASGELPALAVAIALVVQWSRSDARAAARYDRAVDRAERSGEDNAHAAYNRMLAQLAERDPGRR
ncbi:cytochrome c oxidase assembly protein [Dactylosporangium sp. NPDC005572]|uniref:cytochrome c oxidase assembly protein n=1 Tax=Dactylosporangium sp. NPDC005572 TaxID=3156889 RepID=UPI0033AB58B7